MFTKDRMFYREFFSLYWMLVLQNVIILCVNLTDNVLLNHFSMDAMSGASTVNQIQFLIQNIITGVGDGMVILASQYWGQGRIDPVKRLSGIAARFAFGFALLMFALVSFAPQQVLHLFSPKESIINEGVKYIDFMRFTYPIFAVTSILLATLRSVQTVRIAFWISLSTLLTNFLFNYTLIFGNFGFPRLGVTGAGIGTLCARAIEMCIALVYVARIDTKLGIKLKDYQRVDRPLLKDYARAAIPVIAVAAMWGASTALQTIVLGNMPGDPDRVAIAANAAASNLMMILKVASVGAASAAAVLIGKTVGRGDFAKVREYSRTLQFMFLIIGAIIGTLLFLLRQPVLNTLFSGLTDEARQMSNSFLLVMSVTIVGMAYQMPTNTGIIRGGGDSMFCLKLDIISIWMIVLPVSFIAAFLLHWPAYAVFICLNADQVFKCLPIAIKCNRYGWIKKRTRDAVAN